MFVNIQNHTYLTFDEHWGLRKEYDQVLVLILFPSPPPVHDIPYPRTTSEARMKIRVRDTTRTEGSPLGWTS